MADDTTDPIGTQLDRAARHFVQRFGRAPQCAAAAPGRVNLIGEHTDYSDGFVLPLAIERQTVIVAAPTDGRQATVSSRDMDGEATFAVDRSLAPGTPTWANYVKGVVAGCIERGSDPGGFDALIDSTVPVGGGLSSSAALEVAAATVIEALTEAPLAAADKALLCQRAEHEFAGMPCGIMDQSIAVMGRADHAMLLDCRSLAVRHVPLADPQVTVLIVNSNVRHELTGSEYPERRRQCEQAAAAMNVKALRDATMPMLAAAQDHLDLVTHRRARHVVTENNRVQQAADALTVGNWPALGQLMYASHVSLRDDFQVSCPELDLLVELAAGLGASEGVYGSRMTGGGFGGCTVSLVDTNAVEAIVSHIQGEYLRQTGIEPTLFATRPAGGARVLAV